jgi:chromosome partitioning protein
VHAYERHIEAQKPTIWDVFEQHTKTPASPAGSLDIKKAITHRSSNLSGGVIDLIPSRLELAWTLKSPQGKEKELASALEQLKPKYDLILIDCAPTESMLTTAAYLASDFVLIPVKPDYLSAIGIHPKRCSPNGRFARSLREKTGLCLTTR